MIITIFNLDGSKSNLVLRINSTDTVETIFQKISDMEKILPSYLKLYYHGKELKKSTFIKPRIRKEFRQSLGGDKAFGYGSRHLKVALLNEPNCFFTVKYSRRRNDRLFESDLMCFVKSICTYMKNQFDFADNFPSECVVSLFCGDQPVIFYGSNDSVLQEYSTNERNKFPEHRNFEYYSPRNEVWTISFSFQQLTKVSDYNIGRNDEIRAFRINHNKEDEEDLIPSQYLPSPYSYEDHTKERSVFENLGENGGSVCLGISILGVCENKSCEYSGSEVIFKFSEKVIPHLSQQKQGRVNDDAIRESFDIQMDRSIEKDDTIVFGSRCPKCDQDMEPKKFLFYDCFWRYCAILVVQKNDNNNTVTETKRIISEWKVCSVESHQVFDPQKDLITHTNKIRRLQVEVRRKMKPFCGAPGTHILRSPTLHCVICGEGFGLSKLDKCGHYFHKKCLELWDRVDCVRCFGETSTVDGDDVDDTDERLVFVKKEFVEESSSGCKFELVCCDEEGSKYSLFCFKSFV